jgi:hypothetical protein
MLPGSENGVLTSSWLDDLGGVVLVGFTNARLFIGIDLISNLLNRSSVFLMALISSQNRSSSCLFFPQSR